MKTLDLQLSEDININSECTFCHAEFINPKRSINKICRDISLLQGGLLLQSLLR